jgi:transcriptional regulator with XRE-family HTH domain
LKTASRATLSANLRYFRQQRGWSQEVLADQCGLHRTYIGAVERGERNISLDNLERLANALDITLCALLDIPGNSYHVREASCSYPTGTLITHCNKSQANCYL